MSEKAVYLADMYGGDLLEIAKSLCSKPAWAYIGLCFEKTHHFRITKEDLQARYGSLPDEQLCRYLLDELTQQNVTIHELVDALKNPKVALLADARIIESNPYGKSSLATSTITATASKLSINKYLVIVNAKEDFMARLDATLEDLDFEKLPVDLGSFYLWRYKDTLAEDVYLLAMPIVKRGQVLRINQLWSYVSAAMCVACNNRAKFGRIPFDKLTPSLFMEKNAKKCFNLLKAGVKKPPPKNIDAFLYPISRPTTFQLDDSDDIGTWITDATPTPMPDIYVKIKSRGTAVDLTTRAAVTSTIQSTLGLDVLMQGRDAAGTELYFSGPPILAPVLELKKKDLATNLREQKFNLESVAQVSIEEIEQAMATLGSEYTDLQLMDAIIPDLDVVFDLSPKPVDVDALLNDFCEELGHPSTENLGPTATRREFSVGPSEFLPK